MCLNIYNIKEEEVIIKIFSLFDEGRLPWVRVLNTQGTSRSPTFFCGDFFGRMRADCHLLDKGGVAHGLRVVVAILIE